MKPIIGITLECTRDASDARTGGNMRLNWNYAQAVTDAGGVPILIPPTADASAVAELIHGWLIPGGADIDASRFGEENHPEVELQDPARYEIEERLYRALNPATPVLGICYGCQFLNVVRGGSLVQHLPDVEGSIEHREGVPQTYKLDPDSQTCGIFGCADVEGLSYHHQGVGRVGEGLKVVGHCEDGTVEAVEATDRPWMIGVQWHPERTLGDEKMRRLFKEFIAAAARYAESREKVLA